MKNNIHQELEILSNLADESKQLFLFIQDYLHSLETCDDQIKLYTTKRDNVRNYWLSFVVVEKLEKLTDELFALAMDDVEKYKKNSTPTDQSEVAI